MKKRYYETLSVETVSIVSTELIAMSFSGDTDSPSDYSDGDSLEDIVIDNTSSWD